MPNAQIPADSRYAAHSGSRADRMTDVVLSLLFDLSQQAARFGSSNSWTHFAAYDADDFASFTVGRPA